MLKKIEERELARRITEAQALYKDRKSGIDFHAEVDPVSGRPISKYIDGGVETFPVPSAFEVLSVYFEAIALGNTLHPMGLVQTGLDQYGGATFELYTYKSEKIQKLALDKIAQEIEAVYLAEVESANETFIQQQIDAQLRVDAAREEREQAKAVAEKRALVEKQIRETFTEQPTPEPEKVPLARAKR